MNAADHGGLNGRALAMLHDQMCDLEGRIQVLATAVRDIEEIADDNVDLDAHSWNAVWHICTTPAVKQAAGGA